LSEESDLELAKIKSWEESKCKYRELVARKISNKEIKKYEGIIFTVGFSKEPIILNILGFNPSYCFFIHTKETEEVINEIMEEVNLQPTQYQRRILKKDDAADVYKAVKEGLNYLINQNGLTMDEIALDPTGGTKVMSVGCGIAINTYNIDLLYVNSKQYDRRLRRPVAGSEQVINIQNPFEIYYDDLILKGLNMMRNYSFESARNCFIEVEKKAKNPQSAEILRVLCNGLHMWDLFNHEKAIDHLRHAEELNNQYQLFPNLNNIIREWIEILSEIYNDQINWLKIIDLYYNGVRMEEREQYDNATMRYYRMIEMWCQFKLKEQYNLDTQSADYTQIKVDEEQLLSFLRKHSPEKANELIENENIESENRLHQLLLASFNLVWQKIFQKQGKTKSFRESNLLPLKIGLFNGLVFLHIFNEELIDFEFLCKVQNAAESRNNSILAHGLRPINKKDCKRLREICNKLIKEFESNDNCKRIKSRIFNKESLLSIYNIIHKALLSL